MSKLDVIGSGGGGGKSGSSGEAHVPTESPDSLRSRQYARIIDVVSEGEIGGLVNGLQSVYLDGTPLQNADGTFNFSGVRVESRVGTQSQTYIPGFPSVESEVAVSAEVKNAVSVTRQITSHNTDAVRVTLSIPQLTYQEPTTGDITGSSVQIAIDVQSNGGGFVEKVSDTISGKTTSRYQRSYRIELTGSAPWDVRMRRITADSSATNLVNKTWFDSYTEIIDAKLTYPNSALVALEVDASQFRSIPSRGYDIYGIKVRIPSNYNPTTRAYTGLWDGTFSIAWTDNPAWCFYDLLTNERYGLGSFIDQAQVDKWSLYDIARYCDELVPDGFGGTEPRFTCNLFLQTREEAYKVIANFASIFAGITFWSAGSITASADKPSDPSMIFTPANVIEGAFNYSGSSLKARHTVALVTWNDPSDAYRQKIEYVQDDEGVAKYGIVETEVTAFGCTSRGQAHRLGRRILLTELLASETVGFKCGLDGTYCAPGEVIGTIDPVRSGVRFGGRVMSATDTVITIDAPVTLDALKSYTLYCVMPDGSLENRDVVSVTGSVSALTVSAPFSSAPQPDGMWVLSASELVMEQWRILGIVESEPGILEISALAHRPDKYDAIDNNLVLEPLKTSSLSTVPASVTGITLSESLYLTGTEVKSRALIGWDHLDGLRWTVEWRVGEGNWFSYSVDVAQFQIDDTTPGIYEIRIYAVNALGRRGPAPSNFLEILGKTAPPSDVSGFTVIKSNGLALPAWDLSPDLDVRVGGRIVVRHSALVSGATWEASYIVQEFDGNAVAGQCALMTGPYMAKAKDSSCNYSVTTVSFVATEGMVTGFTTIGSVTLSPTFAGSKTNLGVIAGELKLISEELFDSSEDIDSSDDIDGGAIATHGECDFTSVLDLGSSAIRRIQASLTARAFDVGDYFDSDEEIDGPEDFDGAAINDCDATIYCATTPDDPLGSPLWSAWHPFFVGDFEGRALKFRLSIDSGSPSHNMAIAALSVAAKIPA